MKRRWTALRRHTEGLGWAIASSTLGAAIGLLVATLWGHTVGW